MFVRAGGRRRMASAAVGVAMLACAVGCGDSGSSAAPGYGSYPNHRVDGDYDVQPNRARGILVESLRLGDHIAYPSEVDPTLTDGRDAWVLADICGVSTFLSSPQQKALRNYTVDAGSAVSAADKPAADQGSSGTASASKLLSVAALAFPDEPTATAAAPEMERANFNANTTTTPWSSTRSPAETGASSPPIGALGDLRASASNTDSLGLPCTTHIAM